MNNLLEEKKDRIGRNDKCYCGSDKKYKHCCLEGDKDHRRLVVILSKLTNQPIDTFKGLRKVELEDHLYTLERKLKGV